MSLGGLVLAASREFATICLIAIDVFRGFANPYVGILTCIVAPAFLVLARFGRPWSVPTVTMAPRSNVRSAGPLASHEGVRWIPCRTAPEAMIERLTDLPPGVDGLRAKGRVTREDYERVVQPLLEEARSRGRRLRFLYHFGPEFDRFTAGAAWEDARLGLRYLRLFERCAIVSDIGWIRESSRLVGVLMPCPVRVFGNSQWQEALAWLASSDASGGFTYRLLPERGVLVVEPHGPLRSEDFDALALAVDPWLEAHGALRGLIINAREFPGWESLGSFLRHLRFVRDHHRRIRRVALCAGGKLASLAPRLAEHFVTAEIQHFDYDEIDRAIEWASAAPLAE